MEWSTPWTEAQRDRWRAGELAPVWVEQYRDVCFDDDDLRLATSQPKHHYFEWLASINIHIGTGWNVLVEKYETNAHPRKFDLFKERVGADLLRFINDYSTPEFGGTQCPDLFSYDPNGDGWFFCEVKGPNEPLHGHQSDYFKELERRSARPIHMMRFERFA